MKIISGGQTGADRAALDAAIKLGIPHGGWLPKGRKTEDGHLPAGYSLNELPSYSYKKRTEKNVASSDGTLIVAFGPLTGGSALTEHLTVKYNRPCLVLDLNEIPMDEAMDAVVKWLQSNIISTLNVAGPRASGEPRIYRALYDLLLAIDWNKINRGASGSHNHCE